MYKRVTIIQLMPIVLPGLLMKTEANLNCKHGNAGEAKQLQKLINFRLRA